MTCTDLSFGAEVRLVGVDTDGWAVVQPSGIVWFSCGACGHHARGPRRHVAPMLSAHLA